jgi:hypothetical protein
MAAELAGLGGLGGSRASIRHQHEIAVQHDFTFLRTPAQVREYVSKERLERVESSADLVVSKVSFPYARPMVALFIERLAAQYRRATGERLVVTSLTRPTSLQPRNASPLSVHPAGMALDLRVPADASDRAWLEETLLSLERSGVLDATREKRPAHYHVAVFPERYGEYVAPLIARESARAAANAMQAAAIAVRNAAMSATAPAAPPNATLLLSVVAATLVAAVLLLAPRAIRRSPCDVSRHSAQSGL